MAEKATRLGVLGLLAALLLGLVLFGVQRLRADQRAVAAAALPAEGPAAGGQPATPSSAPAAEGAPGADGASTNASQKAETIVVHVVGAVVKPGVYELPAGARAVDAVQAAGGALPNGDPDQLILAQRLSDGDKIWVPAKGEASAPNPPPVAKDATVVPAASRAGGNGGTAGPVKVNINTASEAELEKVPGIGKTTARAIVEYRKSHGRFTKVEDLDNVKGIGPATLAKIRPYLTL